jgi:hypothetical protein
MSKTDNLNIELGSFINLEFYNDSPLINKVFYIDYVDNENLRLIDTSNMEKKFFKINDKRLEISDLKQINILNIPDVKGFARQNDLLPNKWINIHFGGDLPTILTGLITNLENDMIEIKLIGDEIIYIDFAYQGIPLNLPITHIEVRSKPSELENQEQKLAEQISEIGGEEIGGEEIGGEEVVEILDNVSKPVEQFKTEVKEFVMDLNDIQLGPSIGNLQQIVEVSETEKRYSLDQQVNDLLDEMLSHIPNKDRTTRVLNNLHLMLERFQQIRSEFSNFNSVGIIEGIKNFTLEPSLLIKSLIKLNKKLLWILPVVKNRKKVYNVGLDDDGTEIIDYNLHSDLTEITTILDNYKTNNFPNSVSKYTYLINRLNPYFTPFANTLNSDENRLIFQEVVEANLLAIVDNLDNFYSTVFKKKSKLTKKRFLIQKYNLGLNKLKVLEMKSMSMKTELTNLTPNDNMEIKSFISMPRFMFELSKMYLPNTNIYDKSNLNEKYIGYWNFLRKELIVNNKKTINSLNGLNAYPYKPVEELHKEENLQGYFTNLTGNNNELVEIIEKFLSNRFNLSSVLSYLEPFLIYHNELDKSLYVKLTNIILKNIQEYKANLIKNSEILQSEVKGFVDSQIQNYDLLDLLNKSPEFKKFIIEKYSIFNKQETENGYMSYKTTSDILKYVLMIDFGQVLFNALNEINVNLYSDIDLDNVLNNEIKMKNAESQNSENKCEKFEIVKKYIDKDELNDDNNVDTYYDKHYDNTPYLIMNEYKKERELLDPQEFKDFLTEELKKNIGLNNEKALLEAETLITGKKLITNNNYAILIIEDDSGNEQFDYYKRVNNQWEHEKNIANYEVTNNTLCLIQEKCVKDDDTCKDMNLANIDISEQNLQEIVDMVSLKSSESKEAFEKQIMENVNNYVERLKKLFSIKNYNYYKYNNYKVELGHEVNEPTIDIISPYSKLLNLVLAEKDFVKKQHYIMKFSLEFTRPGNDLDGESIHWRYCKSTNIKLLPNFIFYLANVFIENQDYEYHLELVCANIGKLSDDGDSWVDKHSGYVIKKVNFSEDEGYDIQGFKVKTKEVMEQDIGLIANIDEKNLISKYSNPNSIRIIKILGALQKFMGIDILKFSDFIIKNTLTLVDKQIPNQEIYERKSLIKKQKTGKGLPDYNDTLNFSLMITTLGYCLVAIQTAIPSIRTRKSFPGCKKSFVGFPLDGNNMSALEYICCVAHKIKNNNIEPWNSIAKITLTNLVSKVKETLEKFIIGNSEIQKKMHEKMEYLLIEDKDFIPEELDIKNWNGFLPPLFNVEVKNLQNVSKEFLDSINKEILGKSRKQFSKLDAVKTKIIEFSFSIIEAIQKVVEKAEPLLTNINNEPFLENACCNIKEISDVLSYFEEREPNIKQFNRIVQELSNYLQKITNISGAVFYLDPNNTKLVYPQLSNEFSRSTIYKAFIIYCRYNSTLPMNPKFLGVCLEKPDIIKVGDSNENIIQILLNENIVYNNEHLVELMKLVFKENIIHLKLSTTSVSNIEILRVIIDNIITKKQNLFSEEYIKNILEVLDTYNFITTEDDENLNNLKNNLHKENVINKQIFINYLQTHIGFSKIKMKKLKENIDEMMIFEPMGKTELMNANDNSFMKKHIFIQNNIWLLLRVFPNIILNKKEHSLLGSDNMLYSNLSMEHLMSIHRFVDKFYGGFSKFFGKCNLEILLQNLIHNNDDILSLLNTIPFQPTYNENTTGIPIFNYETGTLLYENLFWKSIVLIINLTEDINVTKKIKIYVEKQQVEGGVNEIDIQTNVSLADLGDNNISEYEILDGVKDDLQKQVAQFLMTYLEVFNKYKSGINYNYELIKEKVLIEREREKDQITERLAAKNDDEREVDNYFKKFKLGDWGVGLQKGFFKYDQNVWEAEWEQKIKNDKLDMELKKNDVGNELFDIEKMELQNEQIYALQIEKEELNMGNLPNDDDYGENDGDEFY